MRSISISMTLSNSMRSLSISVAIYDHDCMR